jgi:D-glycero-D-manno-heptose 1,7-bisphosphate phosphatase
MPLTDGLGNAALFCDLVGTLVRMDANRELPRDRGGNLILDLMPGVVEKLRPMRDHLIFIVTNQAGISRGNLTLEQMEAALAELDARLGGIVTAWRICPHDDADGCGCRKPKPGMIAELVETYGVDLTVSTGVGDQAIDEQACKAAGVGRFLYAKDFFG